MLEPVRRIIRTQLARRRDVPEIPSALERLKRNGFSPGSIFDVGAYRGDFAALCFQLWPDTSVTCFEVLPEPSEKILTMARKQKSLHLISCLLGAETRPAVDLNLGETASSVLRERVNGQGRKAKFPMRTVDEVVARDLQGRAPDFLKLDVQGYELEVLKGATRNLSSMKLILAEVNLLDIHESVPLLAEVVSWLSDRGWVAYDICSLIRRPLDLALWQTDIIFVPENSRFRQNKQYA